MPELEVGKSEDRQVCMVDDMEGLSPLAEAYARARGRSSEDRQVCMVDDMEGLSPLTEAYARARGR